MRGAIRALIPAVLATAVLAGCSSSAGTDSGTGTDAGKNGDTAPARAAESTAAEKGASLGVRSRPASFR